MICELRSQCAYYFQSPIQIQPSYSDYSNFFLFVTNLFSYFEYISSFRLKFVKNFTNCRIVGSELIYSHDFTLLKLHLLIFSPSNNPLPLYLYFIRLFRQLREDFWANLEFHHRPHTIRLWSELSKLGPY